MWLRDRLWRLWRWVELDGDAREARGYQRGYNAAWREAAVRYQPQIVAERSATGTADLDHTSEELA